VVAFDWGKDTGVRRARSPVCSTVRCEIHPGLPSQTELHSQTEQSDCHREHN